MGALFTYEDPYGATLEIEGDPAGGFTIVADGHSEPSDVVRVHVTKDTAAALAAALIDPDSAADDQPAAE